VKKENGEPEERSPRRGPKGRNHKRKKPPKKIRRRGLQGKKEKKGKRAQGD